MAISLKWINDYVKVDDVDKVELADKITKAGINIEKVTTTVVRHYKLFVVLLMLEKI